MEAINLRFQFMMVQPKRAAANPMIMSIIHVTCSIWLLFIISNVAQTQYFQYEHYLEQNEMMNSSFLFPIRIKTGSPI